MDLPPFLASGEAARLIPVAADSNKEARATSILMATLSAVPAYSSAMLATLGQRTGIRAKLDCYTEVVLKNDSGEPRCRPDGLIVFDGGRGRAWSCLVEAKIGSADLQSEQVERYLSLAKNNSIDSVLTVSNQFAALPSHSPVKVSRSLIRGVDLYHWSWTFVLTQALLLLNENKFEHPGQRFVLAEMARYFGHASTGVSSFDRMNPEWKDLVTKVQAGATLNRADPVVENTIAAWHQEIRDLCLLMTRKLYRPVRLKLSRIHADDQIQRLKDDSEKLVKEHRLEGVFEIPDAASPLVVVADLLRRSVYVSMILSAPGDKQRASSRISWVIRQLSRANPDGLYVKANWPGRAPSTQLQLTSLRDNPSLLELDNKSLVPSSFEIILVRDLAGKFGGTRTFIEQLEDVVPLFYEQVGQYIRAYVAAPPKIVKTSETDTTKDADGKTAESERVAGSVPDPIDRSGPDIPEIDPRDQI